MFVVYVLFILFGNFKYIIDFIGFKVCCFCIDGRGVYGGCNIW